jgi:hypothetical protein
MKDLVDRVRQLLIKSVGQLTFRDALGPSIALVALLISAGTAYFNLLRQVDDVRLLIVDMPDVSKAKPRAAFGIMCEERYGRCTAMIDA